MGKQDVHLNEPAPKYDSKCKQLFDFLNLQKSFGSTMINMKLSTFIPNTHEGHCPVDDVKNFVEKYTSTSDNAQRLNIRYSEKNNGYYVTRPRVFAVLILKKGRVKVKVEEGFETIGYKNIKKYFEVYTWKYPSDHDTNTYLRYSEEDER